MNESFVKCVTAEEILGTIAQEYRKNILTTVLLNPEPLSNDVNTSYLRLNLG
jgi:hypothetical protein